MEKNAVPPQARSSPRRGYLRLRDIPPELLVRLNRGELETATLTEQAAMDFMALLRSLRGWAGDTAGLLREAEKLRLTEHGIVSRMRLAGEALGRWGAFGNEAALEQLMTHAADTVRGFACYAVAAHPGLEFGAKFERIRPLAADPHFGVREWAWLALRPYVAEMPWAALELLGEWVREADPNLRRFAVEITRPRGVWAKHIPQLVSAPERGLPLLAPCNRDPSRYVRDSVANWLNDAAKAEPAWVRKVCREWLAEHPENAACRYIVCRAQRSIRGKGGA
jgi:3-methyladenine DNA glycosylase AlkC